jgi:hypothetical protein
MACPASIWGLQPTRWILSGAAGPESASAPAAAQLWPPPYSVPWDKRRCFRLWARLPCRREAGLPRMAGPRQGSLDRRHRARQGGAAWACSSPRFQSAYTVGGRISRQPPRGGDRSNLAFVADRGNVVAQLARPEPQLLGTHWLKLPDLAFRRRIEPR